MQKVYRIENLNSDDGLWYNRSGERTDFIINEIDNAKSRDIPMGYNPNIVGGWLSAAETVAAMGDWLSLKDALEFESKGYQFFEVQVPEYRHEYGHVVFQRENAIFVPMALTEFNLV